MVRGRRNPRHIGFSRRLKSARKASGLSYASIAEAAGLSGGAAVLFLEDGRHAPRLDTVQRLAGALDVSAAWLAYGSPYDVAGPAEPGGDVAQRVRELRGARGLSVRALGRTSGTSDTTVRLTEAGTTIPNIAKLEALADALGVAPGWLAFGIGAMEPPPRRRSAGAALSAR